MLTSEMLSNLSGFIGKLYLGMVFYRGVFMKFVLVFIYLGKNGNARGC